MIMYDTHVHTVYSTDSETPMLSQLDTAVKKKLRGICFTDHIDYDFPKGEYVSRKPSKTPLFTFCIEDYKKEIRSLIPRYPDLDILTGIECGMQVLPEIIQKNMELSKDGEIDYLIGSLHLVDRKDPYYPAFWERDQASVLVKRYFEQIVENIDKFHCFDSLGHLDYIVRYAPQTFVYRPDEYREIISEILRFLIQHDIALEVNTSGWKATDYPNPHPDIIQWYVDMGGELITVGSDAHLTEYLGYSFERLHQLLRQKGIHQYVTYHRHKPRYHDI